MASASCAGSPRPSSSHSCWPCKGETHLGLGETDVGHENTKTRRKPLLLLFLLRAFVFSWLHFFLMTPTQVVVVGGGPGGYAAAFLAADLGLSTALVDPEGNPGAV